MAAVASTFAGILGCPLKQVAITTPVRTSLLRLVGHRRWTSKRFALHEFAVSGGVGRALGSRPRIWDACVEVSGDRTIIPKRRPYRSLLPASLTQGNYLSRLLGLPQGRLKDHINERPLVRPIGPLPSSVRPAVLEKHLSQVADDYGFEKWKAPVQMAQVRRFELPVVSGWKVTHPVIDQAKPVRPGFERVVRMLWRRTTGPKRLITTDVYVCATARAARRRLVAVLGRFSGVKLVALKSVLPEIQSSASLNQEMQFATRDGSAIVASYLNVVVVVRRATPGKSVIPDVRAFFQAIESQLKNAH